MTPSITVPGADEITWQVTFGSAVLHVVYVGALLAGTLCVIWTSCPVFCTIPLPVTEVTWKVVTWVESVNDTLFVCPPPGVAVELENTSELPADPPARGKSSEEPPPFTSCAVVNAIGPSSVGAAGWNPVALFCGSWLPFWSNTLATVLATFRVSAVLSGTAIW